MAQPGRKDLIRFSFSPTSYIDIKLLYDDAPKTCKALVESLFPSSPEVTPTVVKTLHAKNSGAEALFITPTVISDVGDENTTVNVTVGDMLFCFEPIGICQHAKTADRSEVAWVYDVACVPRRWVSSPLGSDPTNQTPPFETVDVPLNKWGKVVREEGGFYSMCNDLCRSGALDMKIQWVE